MPSLRVLMLQPVSGRSLPHGMGLRLDHSLVGYSHNFCATFTSAHLVGGANYRSKVIYVAGLIL